MRKVLVIGSGGAGKSTFARRLGALLELEVIHLDFLFWSGWRDHERWAIIAGDWRAKRKMLSRRAF